MAENDANPMTSADVTPPAATEFQPAEPLKNAGVEFDAEGGTLASSGSRTDQAKQSFKEHADKYGAQATDRIRSLADTGKERATGALGQLSTLLNDAAGQVDEKLGAQYGDYARQAATTVSGFADNLQAKDVDQLLDDARGYVRRSPAVAIGIAAALGFALARVVQSGIDQKNA